MNMFAKVATVALLALLSTPLLAAEKKQSEDEKFRAEVKDMASQIQTPAGRVSVVGKFLALHGDELGDKPFPKVVGYISQKGTLIPVMVIDEKMFKSIGACDKKEVTLQGRCIEKGDQGKVLVADLALIPETPPAGPVHRRGSL